MKEETNDINELIIRYLDGSAELEEKVLLLQWLKQSDDNRDDFIATRDLQCRCRKRIGGRYRFGEAERPHFAGTRSDGEEITNGKKNIIACLALDASCCRVVAFVGNRLWYRQAE